MDTSIGQIGDRVAGIDSAKRNTDLADARRRASQAAIQSADAAKARKADQRQMARAILERAVGANTRLSIARNDATNSFTYRAIDTSSGEVVKEWPPAQFAKFLQQNGGAEALVHDALSGLLLDQQV